VIHTVFCSTAETELQWQAELLEYSWGHVRQPGELVRLVPSRPGAPAPRHRFARVVQTLAWSPHPYHGDAYPPYDKPASVLEWLFGERIDGTVLLVEPHCIFRSPIAAEVARGQARATAWPGLPRGDGPFGLGPGFAFLERFCVDRTLPLPAVALPLLIHSSDLRRFAARWLELMSIIRAETATSVGGPAPDADNVAYAIAAAEAGVRHSASDIGVGTDTAESAAPILDYCRPIASTRGDVLWEPAAGIDRARVAPERAPPGTGREFLTALAAFVARRDEGSEHAFLRPCRRNGVREGRLLGSLFLDVPGRSDTVSLNATGAAIWECCDGKRSLAEIERELEARYEAAPGTLRADVQAAIARLESIGAIKLEPA
jgi:hypothetical protein